MTSVMKKGPFVKPAGRRGANMLTSTTSEALRTTLLDLTKKIEVMERPLDQGEVKYLIEDLQLPISVDQGINFITRWKMGVGLELQEVGL